MRRPLAFITHAIKTAVFLLAVFPAFVVAKTTIITGRLAMDGRAARGVTNAADMSHCATYPPFKQALAVTDMLGRYEVAIDTECLIVSVIPVSNEIFVPAYHTFFFSQADG